MGLFKFKDMGKKLVTLQRHNEVRNRLHRDKKAPVYNGIACPECGKEMMDSEPGVHLMSKPAKKNIHCPECGYKDYAIV